MLALLAGGAVFFLLDVSWDNDGWQQAAVAALFWIAFVGTALTLVAVWQARKRDRTAER